MEQLIQELVNRDTYQSPARVEEVQREIQRLQRQPAGWNLGLELLNKNKSYFRFYGALTLIIKIRTEAAFLEAQKGLHEVILSALTISYVSLLNEREQQFVVRKVCSALAAYSLHRNASGFFPFRRILTSLCGTQLANDETVGDFHQVWNEVEKVTSQQLRGLLWLSSALVEEVSRNDLSDIEDVESVEKVAKNATDVWYLIYLILRCLHLRHGYVSSTDQAVANHLSSSTDSDLLEVSKDALETASTWVNFHAEADADTSTNKVIDATMGLILRCFFLPGISDNAISCLNDIVLQAPKYLTRDGPEDIGMLLSSQQAESHVTNLLRGSFDVEAVNFVGFVVSLLDLHDLSSPSAYEDPNLKRILAILQTLLYTPGIAVMDDEICQTVLDAFNQIAEGWSDWAGTGPGDQFLKPIILEACLQYVVKTRYPAEHGENSFESWEGEDQAQFQDLRHDVQDLLLASYACIGPELLVRLAHAFQSLEASFDWENFEAHLYCLGAFSDVISNAPSHLGRHVVDVLSSQLWSHLVSNVDVAPASARRGAINFIARNTFILQHHPSYLLSCVNFLFASLNLPGSTAAASRAIFTLCNKQRSILLEALPQLIDSVAALTEIPLEERHRLFGAVAAIVQAIPREEDKVVPLGRIFNLISQFSGHAFSQPADEGLLIAIDILQTVAAVGKGLRAPADRPIDLDSSPNAEGQDFWIEGGGKNVQQNIQSVIDNFLGAYPTESLLIEATCDILKSGYTELHPSAFKFHARYSASLFARKIHFSTPRIGLILDTASSFLAANASNPEQIREEILAVSSAITSSQHALLDSLITAKKYEDHEFTHSSLEYCTRMLPKYGYYFSDKALSEAWQVLFEFALLAIENPDTLPRRYSAQFWAAIFEHSPTLTADASQNLGECIQYYGLRFTTTLLRLLAGGAARSELDVLSEPLKKLVCKQGVLGARLLRESAMQVGGADTRAKRFVEQVIGLRGGRKTGEVVKEFWVGSRGLAFTYAR